MPLVHVQLSAKVSAETEAVLLQDLSQSVAKRLGKPESYMMVVLRCGVPMMMGARTEAAAWVEVRSVGTISPAQAKDVAGAVSHSLAKAAGLDEDRVYCTFQGVPGTHWAQGGNTFG